jgi:hypothetical protein
MATGDRKRASQGKGTATQRPAAGAKGPLSDVQRGLKDVAPGAEVEHEGATEAQVGDRGGPGVGFDQEPEREKDEGGVS